MKFAVIAFTGRGGALAVKLCRMLERSGCECTGYIKMKEPPEMPLRPVAVPCAQWAGEMFGKMDALLFIGACGIAVRAIAPWLKSKAADPAVVVLDENGRYVISLLSGHMGGANVLARQIAGITGGEAVITTATDGRGLFSVDSWAKLNDLVIDHLPTAKAVSAALLEGEEVGLSSDFPIASQLPRGIALRPSGPVGIAITLDPRVRPFDTTLHLIPRAVILGIGCRRDILASAVEKAVWESISEAGISLKSIKGVATIDRKAGEPGLLAFCQKWEIPLTAFSAGALLEAPGEFSASPFVERTVGVDNVCERAAALLSGGRLILPKQCRDGVTVAAAMEPVTITFEEAAP